MNQPNYSWSAGQILQNRYQLQQQLGHNGDRQTWLAKDLILQQSGSVVIKLLPFHAQMQWDELKLFEREIAVLKTLNHSRVPSYLDSCEIDSSTGISWFVLVEAFIPGRSLAEIIQQGQPLTTAQICQIAMQVLIILSDLHGRNPQILHRDIKPSNLMLGKDSQIYLIDFGAVQDQQSTGATFTIVGTSGYAPPEQFFGRAVAESDLYALGATLIHLLTGTFPGDLPQRELRIQFRDAVMIPDSLAEWIEKLTAPDVKDRFRTARQALEALKTIDLKPTVRSQPSPPRSRIRLDKTPHRLMINFPGIGLSPRQIAVFLLQFSLLGILICWLWTGFPPTDSLPKVALNDGEMVILIQFIRVVATILWWMTFYTVMVQALRKWQPNQIDFHKDRFRLDWRILGRCLWRQSGYISNIQEIDAGMQVSTHKPWFGKRSQTPMILIQAGKRRYTFGAVQNRVKAERTTMTVVGTYGYTPLEQFRGQTVPASDLYALGATLIHLLTGIAPAELPQKQLRIQFADLAGVSLSFQRWLEMLVEPALEHRFSTARPALESLQTGINKPLNTIPQPLGSRVKLQSSPDRLIIKIPAPKIRPISAAFTLVIMFAIALLLRWLTFLAQFMSPVILGIILTFWIVWAITLIYYLSRYLRFLRCQVVQFNRTQFIIEKQISHIPYHRQKGQIQNIQAVKQSVQKSQARSLWLQSGKIEFDIVTLQTAKQTYNIGIELTASECAWLAQEINQWLKPLP